MPKLTPAALVARSALFTYLTPRLAQDSRLNLDPIVNGVTSRNYNSKKAGIVSAVKSATRGKLAKDADIMDLANLLDALSPSAGQADAAVQIDPNGAAPPAAAQPVVPPQAPAAKVEVQPQDDEPDDIVAKIKAYLEEQGVAPQILQNLDAFLAEPTDPKPDVGDPVEEKPAPEPSPPPKDGEDNALEGITAEPSTGLDNDLEDMVVTVDPVNKPAIVGSGDNPVIITGDEDDEDEEKKPWETANDEITPKQQEGQVITKATMDAAIRMAQDSAIKNQRDIRNAERFVRPWVGDLAMDAARPSDIYRATLVALGMDAAKVKKMHPDALLPVLEAQPRPTTRRVPTHTIAADAKPAQSFLERFPEVSKISVQ